MRRTRVRLQLHPSDLSFLSEIRFCEEKSQTRWNLPHLMIPNCGMKNKFLVVCPRYLVSATIVSDKYCWTEFEPPSFLLKELIYNFIVPGSQNLKQADSSSSPPRLEALTSHPLLSSAIAPVTSVPSLVSNPLHPMFHQHPMLQSHPGLICRPPLLSAHGHMMPQSLLHGLYSQSSKRPCFTYRLEVLSIQSQR